MPGPQPYANTLFRLTPLFTPPRGVGDAAPTNLPQTFWLLAGADCIRETGLSTNLPQTFWLLAGEGFILPVSLTPAFLKNFSCKIPFSAL